MGGANADEIQQRCIAVALDLPRRCPAIAGMYWWKWFPELPSREEENYRLQTPAIKALIAKHWKCRRFARSKGMQRPRWPPYTLRPNFFSSSPNEIWIIVGRPCGQQ